MFYSQCLLSRKGPLGAIWVAAYSFKKLKKSMVNQTDISSSVDKILQDEWDAVAYRVLAYLLLGVVRIYSKKVEYLFNDCHEILIKINKFVVSTKENAAADKQRAPYYTVTLPDRFELDAFDLGILECEDVNGCNVVSHEDITLKDCPKGKGIGQFYSETYDYEEFGACDNFFLADFTPVKDVLSSYLLDFDMELRTSNDEANSVATIEKLQENRFSQEECAYLENFGGVLDETPNQVKQHGEDRETNEEQIKAPDTVMSEDGIQGEASPERLRDLRLSPLEGLNLETFYGTEREPSYHVRSPSEGHQIDREEIMEPELVQLESQTCQVIRQDHNLISSEADMEKLQSCTVSQDMDLDMFCGAKQPQELVCSSGDGNHNDGEPTKVPEMISPGSTKRQIIVQEDPNPISVAYGETPSAKLPGALDTPKFMVVPTPATEESAQISTPVSKESARIFTPVSKESARIFTPATKKSVRISRPATTKSARIPRKRNCVIDDMTMLSNEEVRQSINDASDLVSKRRKVPQTALAAWKACRIGNFTHDFLEPLIPAGVSQELRSLFCYKVKIIEPADTVRPLEKLDVLESPRVGRWEQIEIAPETPVLRSQSLKSFESPKSPEAPDVDMVRAEPSGRIEREPSPGREPTDPYGDAEEAPLLGRDQADPYGRAEEVPLLGREQADQYGSAKEVPLLGREQADPYGSADEVSLLGREQADQYGSAEEVPLLGREQADTYGSAEEVPLLDRGHDHDFNLLNEEEIDFCEGVNPELEGLSGRTRMVARYLHRHFSDCKNRGGEEVNLLQLSEGRTKKESARLFYEILVLKTRGYVDVKQDDAYGAILIWKLPKWDQTWGDDMVNRTSEPMYLCAPA